MTIKTPLGASRAGFFAAASSLPMLRGPTITFAPEDDGGGGGDQGAGDAETFEQFEALVNDTGGGDSDDEGDGDGEEQGEGQGEQAPKPKQTAQERIDELTKLRRDAERRAEEAERKLADAGKPKPKAEAEGEAQPNKEDGPPDPSKFKYGDTDPEYIKALARYETREAMKAERQEQERNEQVAAIKQTWETRVAEFAKDKPDFAEKTGADNLPISPAMADAIITADGGPAVIYHLAENPDEARRIAALPTFAQVREIGRLEGRLERLAEAESTQNDNPKPASKAPTPPPQTRGLGGRFKVAADTDDFGDFEKQYGGR